MRTAITFALAACCIASSASAQEIRSGSGGATLDPARDDTATRYVAVATTGKAYDVNSVLTCALDLGPGANNCLGTDGSGNVVIGGGGVPNVLFGITGNVSISGNGGVTITNSALNAFFNTILTNTASGKPVLVDDADGFRIAAKTLPACGTVLEGTELIDSAAGGTSGARTRKCLCTSDGAGAPAYAWQNMVTGTVGTSTACSP